VLETDDDRRRHERGRIRRERRLQEDRDGDTGQ